MECFKNFEPRLYQETIFASSMQSSTLVVLPTGLGKTAISMMLAAARLKHYPDSKIVIMAPTRPLVNQHLETFQDFFDMKFLHPDEMVVFTGQIKPEVRQEMWKEAKVIFTTPQGLENDVLSSRIKLTDVSLIVFDEAHRATGDYSYVWLARQYMKQAKHPLSLSLTASPGGDAESIKEVCNNLYIENIEVRDKESPDVKPYVKETKIQWVEVDLPESFQEISKPLKEMMVSRVKLIANYISQVNPRFKNPQYVSKIDLLRLQGKLQGMVGQTTDSSIYQTISITAQVIKLQHAVELLETQGVAPATVYMDEIWKQGPKGKSKAVQNIVQDPKFKIAISKLWNLSSTEVRHPKTGKVVDIIKARLARIPDAKIIVFNNYRDSIANLKQLFDKNNITSEIFVGQAKKKGMGITQKEQLQLIQDFRDGKHNVMIMSSVGEEGLDIPAVDLVVFYEPAPSAIRQIQRAGRTGRQEKGEVIILMAKGTKDVAYHWATKNKQKRMYDVLDNVKKTMDLPGFTEPQTTLDDVKTQEIIVDTREKANRIVKKFVDDGYKINLKQLNVADYVLSEQVGVEFKTKKDFVDSIVDGRLMEQASALSRTFVRPLIVVQGEEDIYSLRNVHSNSILGAMTAIAVSFKVPILFTRNEKETYQLFKSIIDKQEKVDFNPHTLKPKSLEEQQEYVVSSFPGVGISLAKEMLKHFGTVNAVLSASIEELGEVKQMGKIKAQKMKDVLEKKYL